MVVVVVVVRGEAVADVGEKQRTGAYIHTEGGSAECCASISASVTVD